MLWNRFLPEMKARVSILEAAATSFAAGSLTLPQQKAANAAAHKLAGGLGTFGLTKGTVLARELEIMYSQEDGPDPTAGNRLQFITAELRTIIEDRK